MRLVVLLLGKKVRRALWYAVLLLAAAEGRSKKDVVGRKQQKNPTTSKFDSLLLRLAMTLEPLSAPVRVDYDSDGSVGFSSIAFAFLDHCCAYLRCRDQRSAFFSSFTRSRMLCPVNQSVYDFEYTVLSPNSS